MIAIISDSHIPHRAEEIPEQFMHKIKEAEVTVHAGDFETKEVYDQIEEQAQKFYAVKGNCDRFSLKQSQKFEYKDYNFGVYHGTGITPRGHHPTLADIAKNKLNVDILIHGHTHQQEAIKKNNELILNPGSCTGVGGGSSTPGNPRMMTLEIKKGLIKVNKIRKTENKLEKELKEFKI